MAKPVDVLDEYGVNWLVFDNDPASELVKPLVKLGLTLVVLPRESIKHGTMVEVPEPDLGWVTKELLEIEEVRQQVLRQIRARQIYCHLTGDSIGNS